MPAIPQVELYLAKSLSELREKANVNESSLLLRSANLLSSSAMKLYLEAKRVMIEDEEKAYILFFRCLNTAEYVRKKPESKLASFHEVFDKKRYVDALGILEKLSISLEKRYRMKKEAQDATYRQKFLPSIGSVPSPGKKPDDKGNIIELLASTKTNTELENGTHESDVVDSKEDTTIGAMELYELMQDKGTSIIIFDCRPAEEFKESHIIHPSCVNIPAEVLKPGMTAAALGAVLQGEARDSWNRRSLVDFVILMDEDSSERNMVPHGALNSLNLAISKWDPRTVLKKNPLIFENGFQEWVMHYPTTVTKVPVMSTVSVNSLDFQNSLQFIDVEYPDLDEISAPANNKEVLNTGFRETLPVDGNNRSVLQATENIPGLNSAFYVEKSINGQFGDGPKPNSVPIFDRKSKPILSAVAKPKAAWSEGGVAVDGEKEVSAFEALRQRREMEASLAMLEEVQKKEEILLNDLRVAQELNRVLQEKCKMDEEEKQLLKMKLQSEAEEIGRANQAQKDEKRKQLDSDVERSRQERKKSEKLKKEAEEQRLKLEKLKLEDKRPGDTAPAAPLSGGATHIPQSGGEEPAPSLRPNTAPASKPAIVHQASVPSVPKENQKKWTDSPGVYRTKLKEETDGRGSVNRSLSRSHSSPNIAQMSAEEDQRGQAIHSLGPDRLFKQTKLTEECSPSINRALKPTDMAATRMRNFSPVFSSQPNVQTGLKNLGNTCFMNSVLQCLSHTQQLVIYLISGAYEYDICRTSATGSRGVVIQELASVLKNLWQAYRHISPHEFKNTVSRYIAVCEGYDQQDAHEFLVVLMDKLHMDTNKSGGKKGLSPPDLDKVSSASDALNKFWCWHLQLHSSYFVNNFEGVLQSKLTCSVCKHHAYTYEVFSCLSLPIPSNNKCSLKDCIQSLLKAETIRGDAGWKCPMCKRKQEAQKEMGLCRLPPILIIHLKRFSYEGLWRRKLVTSVDFPLSDLDMQPYLIVPTNKSKYDLYGVVNHYGTLEGGHYTAYCKGDKWFSFDDHDVQPISTSSVKTSAAYILFYTCTSV